MLEILALTQNEKIVLFPVEYCRFMTRINSFKSLTKPLLSFVYNSNNFVQSLFFNVSPISFSTSEYASNHCSSVASSPTTHSPLILICNSSLQSASLKSTFTINFCGYHTRKKQTTKDDKKGVRIRKAQNKK